MTFDDYAYNKINEAIFDIKKINKKEQKNKNSIKLEALDGSFFDDDAFKSGSEEGEENNEPLGD